MFEDRLHEVAARIDGAQALSLVGRDGVPVDSVVFGEGTDVEMLGAELVTQAAALDRNCNEFSFGAVKQLTVASTGRLLMLSSVAPDYFLVFVGSRPEAYGRARFELRRASLHLGRL